MDLSVDEDGYNSSTGSVDEDAELELSCALHDLALKVKNFEFNMQGRFQHDNGDEEEEITEDFDHVDEEEANYYNLDSASPKRRRRRSSDFKTEPQHDEEEEMDTEDDHPEAKSGLDTSGSEEDWDSQEEKEELCELKQNIAKLLQSMREEAKTLENNPADCKK
ncbi:hypothetical protein PHMEG_00017989 [Phytophthora megakarya]|uniref:Uncharacterized protein n=1 Tax=Phytophthora megakarya TaxID=4795 RepID=A0A225VVF2_9STRA|nr:hypothetical protein PHMEG_00017989 [Phytophthora megakarya]